MCFYKADVETVDSIGIEELTISFVCQNHPRKLFRHLEKVRDWEIKRSAEGIYHVLGVMNIIVRANEEKFKEEKGMCEALRELMKEEFDEQRMEGKKIGEEIGESRINELNQRLAQAGRVDDIIKAAGDKIYQDSLIKEFGL